MYTAYSAQTAIAANVKNMSQIYTNLSHDCNIDVIALSCFYQINLLTIRKNLAVKESSAIKWAALVIGLGLAISLGVWLASTPRNRPVDPRIEKLRVERELQLEQRKSIELQRLEQKEVFQAAANKLTGGGCDQQAIITVVAALTRAAENRKISDLTESYFAECGIVEQIMRNKISADMAVNEYQRAERTAKEIVDRFPNVPDHWAWLSTAREKRGNLDGAVSAYRHALSLFPEPSKVAGSEYYRLSRLLEQQGRFCDASDPLKQYVSYDPQKRMSAEVTSLLENLEKKGDCKNAMKSPATVRVMSIAQDGAFIITALINGKQAKLLVDTGASYVYLNRSFALGAGIPIKPEDTIVSLTANGKVISNSSRISTLQVGGATAKGVTCAVQGIGVPPLEGIDGLLGLSFLSRFKFSVDGRQLVLETQKL
jgi:clan AA aspartic protease (TIGR02281 family)